MSDYRESLEFQKRTIEQKIKDAKLGQERDSDLAELYEDLREINRVLIPKDNKKAFGFW